MHAFDCGNVNVKDKLKHRALLSSASSIFIAYMICWNQLYFEIYEYSKESFKYPINMHNMDHVWLCSGKKWQKLHMAAHTWAMYISS